MIYSGSGSGSGSCKKFRIHNTACKGNLQQQFLDWRYSQLCWYFFDPALWTFAPLPYCLDQLSPFPVWISIRYIYTYTVCWGGVGGVWGYVPQTDKHLSQSPFTGQFFRWWHFAMPSLRLSFYGLLLLYKKIHTAQNVWLEKRRFLAGRERCRLHSHSFIFKIKILKMQQFCCSIFQPLLVIFCQTSATNFFCHFIFFRHFWAFWPKFLPPCSNSIFRGGRCKYFGHIFHKWAEYKICGSI
jgi:hypothetical protein